MKEKNAVEKLTQKMEKEFLGKMLFENQKEYIPSDLIMGNLLKRKDYLERMKKDVKKRMLYMPEGEVRTIISNGSVQFYYVDPAAPTKHGKYMRKEEKEKAVALLQKNYDMKVYHELIQEEKYLNKLIKKYKANSLEEMNDKFGKQKRSMIFTAVESSDELVEKWNQIHYEPGSFENEDTEIYSGRNERVRSKSEKIIADRLASLDIPYHYEYPLLFDDKTIPYRPDFMVLNKRTQQVYFWEHLGMMDTTSYLNHNLKKLEDYSKHGIIIGKNLLLTFESEKKQISETMLKKTIESYLL